MGVFAGWGNGWEVIAPFLLYDLFQFGSVSCRGSSMKRLKSSDDLNSYGEKGVFKDWGRKGEDLSLHRSSSHRGFHYKSENGKKGVSSSSSRYDRSEDDREVSRSSRKRPDYDVESYDRRKSYDRYRDGGERGILSSSPRGGYGPERIHRSESFSVSRREFPKGFRSERDRSRREGSVSSWRRFGGGKDVEEGNRSGGDSARGSKGVAEDVGKVRSPQGLRDAKSPPWSRDSGSEQSRSVEVKKSESLPVESANSSEMEEGELEPDPEAIPVIEPTAEDQAAVVLTTNQELHCENAVENKHAEDGEKSMPKEKIQHDQVSILAEKAEVGQSETIQYVKKNGHKLSDSSIHETTDSVDAIENSVENERKNDDEGTHNNDSCKEEVSITPAEKSQALGEEQKQEKGILLEVKREDIQTHEPSKEVAEGNSASRFVSLVTQELTQSFKDKGKSVAFSPSSGAALGEDSLRIENESRGTVTCRENDMEGPSTRGFELFFKDPVKKPEKVEQSGLNNPKDEKLAFEPLDLSLSLPNILLPIGSQHTAQAPGSPGRASSAQSLASSFRTSSDGFTASISFSGSQNFSHNPSCSLTQHSIDYEKSVGSRPIFQPVDQVTPVTWQVQSSDEHKKGEVPMYHRSLSNGSGFFHQSQSAQGVSNGAEGSSRVPLGLERQQSVNKQLSGTRSRHLNDVRSPSQSAGSHENGPEYGKDRKRGMREKIGSLYRSNSRDETDKLLTGAADLMIEPILTMVVSEPLHIVARKFNEMTAQSVTCIKESVRDVILNPCKGKHLSAFQKVLERRSDITLEMLLKSHRVQLEILVSLKTGIQDFLQRNYDIPSSDLAEIFLNLRCRNLTCRSLLPVDECDCKICVQKTGFCCECMCLLCSKFDMASNTCSWVGCDVCLHWCHTDCGLRESYIRNGHSATRAQGKTEMQFHCVACDHPSEMFGFVKEVFQNFAKGWTSETLSKELEYVRRIFSASDDNRGKRLHEIAIQMLSRLANKSDLQDVRSCIMGFFNESDSFKSGIVPAAHGKEQAKKNQGDGNNGIAGTSQEPVWLKSVHSEKPSPFEKPAGFLPSYDYERNDKHLSNSDLRRNAPREPVFDELDSIVRIKQAEAKMFQTRADDARREADGLKRIAMAKNEKIEEEFASRILKLHLPEAEEIRHQKFEELQALERAHQEYFNMKVRMEAEIKDLLLKMEATKRNFSS